MNYSFYTRMDGQVFGSYSVSEITYTVKNIFKNN